MSLRFKFDASRYRQKLKRAKSLIRPAQLKPLVDDFTRKSLATASRLTPVRDYSLITAAQSHQYDLWLAQGGGGVSRRHFIQQRAQARFLFKASWGHIARSLGFFIPESASVMASTTRRNPPENPPMGKGRVRTGAYSYRIDIYNPFLEAPERTYKPFLGSAIMAEARKKHEAQFLRKAANFIKQQLWKALK